MYDDAFTIHMVEMENEDEFNFVAGMVPYLLNLIKDVSITLKLFSNYTRNYAKVSSTWNRLVNPLIFQVKLRF